MEIWLRQGEERLRLPVLPSEVVMGSTSNNKKVDINAVGEVMLLGNEDLRTLSISSFFPNQDYYFNEYSDVEDPWVTVRRILKWKASKEPIRVIITSTLLNHEMGIEDFEYGVRDGSGDVHFSLSLKDYRRVGARTRVSSRYVEPKTKRPTRKPKRKTYTVKKGDNLWNIAKKHTGNAQNYKRIAKENGISNPNVIHPGQVINL